MDKDTKHLQEQVDYVAKQLEHLTLDYSWYEDLTDEEREQYDNGKVMGVAAYLQDAYDIDYTISSKGDFKGARYCVALGGPNIYIDTVQGKVQGYWWGSYAEALIPSEAISIIDEWAEEMWACTK